MKALWIALACLALAQHPARGQAASVAADGAGAPETPGAQGGALNAALGHAARLRARSVGTDLSEVDLGVPFDLELEIAHAPGLRFHVDAAALEADPAWALLDGPRMERDPVQPDGRERTRTVWRACVLEAGELELPALDVREESTAATPADPASAPLQLERAHLSVRGVLLEGEDAPRPQDAFLGLPEARGVPAAARWGAALGVLAVVALAAWAVRRARARPRTPMPAPTPLERLASLEQGVLDTPESVRDAHYELVAALRQELGRAALAPAAPGAPDAPGARSEAFTDEEWLARAARDLEPARAVELGRLLSDCAQVKYGGQRPTHWATRERIARARELAGAARPSALPAASSPSYGAGAEEESP